MQIIKQSSKLALVILTGLALVYGQPKAVDAGQIKGGQWKQEWDETKRDFEEYTGRKKPNPVVLGVFRGYTGLDRALGRLDSTYNRVSAQKNQRNLTAFENALNAFVGKKNAYLALLKDTIADEAEKGSNYVKGLKILRKDLKAIEAHAKHRLKILQDMVAGVERVEAMKAAVVPSLEAALRRGKLFVARVEKKPTKKFWNANIKDAARDIWLQCLTLTSEHRKGNVELDDPPPKKYVDMLAPYGTSKIRVKKAEVAEMVEDGMEKKEAEKQLVEAYLVNYAKAVRKLSIWFKDEFR